jgi:hypothetical protein
MHLDYGIVRLKGRPWTQHAREFLEFVREAQRAAMADDAQLVARYGGRRYRKKPGGKAALTRAARDLSRKRER